jgi:fibronectin-binding autotransporter adhesin
MKRNQDSIILTNSAAAAAVADQRKRARRHLCLWAAMGLLATSAADGATTAWQGGGGDLNWSTDANWTNAAPTATTDVYFMGTDATGSAGIPNNVVSTNTSIRSLLLFNETTGTAHSTTINPGVTLTISNAATSGTVLQGGDGVAASKTVTHYFQGTDGASLAVIATNMTMTVRQQVSSGSKRYTVDMSGLDNFTAYMTRIYVAGDGLTRPAGTLLLAKTNLLVLGSTTDAGLKVGYTTGSGMTDSSQVSLGMTNGVFCDYGIGVGLLKAGGGCTLNFNPATATGGSAYFRDRVGTGRQSNWLIGDASSGAYSGNLAKGTVDFSLGTVDALVGTLVVGRNQNSGGGVEIGGAQGYLTFNSGTIDVNTAIIGYEMLDYGPAAKGFVNVDGTAQLIVNTSMQLGRFTAMVLTNGISTAVLNIGTLSGNGSVTVKGNITTTTSALNPNNQSEIHVVNGGSLSVKGTVGPLAAFELSGSTLTLDLGTSPNPTSAVCATTNLQTAAPLTLNLLGGAALSVGQFSLIKYQNLPSGNAGDDFTTVSLPYSIQGYLSNNTANSSIDLVITNKLVTVWNGNINGDWDINTTPNWKDGTTGVSMTYHQAAVPGDIVQFDDTAAGTTTVALTTDTLSPNSVTVANDTKAYTFTGSGRLTGPTPLLKSGSGTLTINNSGSNDFSGGITLSGGSLLLGGGANRLPVGATVTLANAAATVLDLNNQDQALAMIAGGGASGGNINLGSATLTISGGGGSYGGIISGAGRLIKTNSGTLTLSGANLYSGGTLITTNATVAVANTSGSGLGAGNVDIVPGGSLQIGAGGAAGSLGANVITNNGSVVFNRSDDITFANRITGTGNVSKVLANVVTLPSANDYTGVTTISAGALRVTDPNALGTAVSPGTNNYSTDIPNALSAHLELANNITFTEAIRIASKGGSTPITTPAILSVSGTNTLAGQIMQSSGGSQYNFQAAAGSKLIVSGKFIAGPLLVSGFPYYILDGAGDGEVTSDLINGSSFSNMTNNLFKLGAGTWTLSGSNTYIGHTVISNGTLIVNGSVLGTNTVPVNAVNFYLGLQVRSIGKLAGNGLIRCVVTNAGTLAPGAPIGALTISNSLALLAGSSNVFEVSASSYDQVRGLSSVYFGGNLQVVVVGNLNGGEVFKLFDAASYNGTFDTVDLPTLPAPLAWDSSELYTAGTLRVTGGNIRIGQLGHAVDGNFVMTGTSAAAGQGYRVLATTNVADPLSWILAGSGTFNAGDGGFAFTDLSSTNFPQRFYRVVTP